MNLQFGIGQVLNNNAAQSRFELGSIRAREKTLISRRVLFTSDMDNKEIHGRVGGFLPFDLSPSVVPKVAGLTGKDRADQAHIKMSKLVLQTIRGDIASMLNSL